MLDVFSSPLLLKKPLSPVWLSGKEVLPLVEGGKGVAVSTGLSSGAWAACGGVGTFSGVNAWFTDGVGNIVPQVYHGKTRQDRQQELIAYGIRGGIEQAKIAHETSKGEGRIHMNVLWEMGGVEPILRGILDSVAPLIHGVTCGAGMPYRLAELTASYGLYYVPIVSSARAFSALWRRAYNKWPQWLGGVVYEDPWKAGGHNGLSNQEDPLMPQDPYNRVVLLRETMNGFGLQNIPIIMAGGVWCLKEWEHFMDNPEIGPIAFQLGTRPLLTKESPISEEWRQELRHLKKGDVVLNTFSPTGFYSSAVNNAFLQELQERSHRQIPFSLTDLDNQDQVSLILERGREVFVSPQHRDLAEKWRQEGFTFSLRTPSNTLIFVTPEKAQEIHEDQKNCMGCLSACLFSNWDQHRGSTGRKPDPRSFCIQKTLQNSIHGHDIQHNLMFGGHNAYRFAEDPFYANNFTPTVRELIEALKKGL